MDRSSEDLRSRLTIAALAFGALMIVSPTLCMGFTVFIIPHSFIATAMGLAMLPISSLVALMAWQGFEVDEFLHDAFLVLFMQQGDGLKRLYLPDQAQSVTAAAISLIAIPVLVCGLAGFCASLLSHIGLISAVGLYATFGFIYGLLLFSAIWYWVMPLMAEARRL